LLGFWIGWLGFWFWAWHDFHPVVRAARRISQEPGPGVDVLLAVEDHALSGRVAYEPARSPARYWFEGEWGPVCHYCANAVEAAFKVCCHRFHAFAPCGFVGEFDLKVCELSRRQF
jgi:hypothetical protein